MFANKYFTEAAQRENFSINYKVFSFNYQIKVFDDACADHEGGQGSGPPPPLKNHKNKVFLSNTGPDPLKNHKATKPDFNIGPLSARQRNVI